MCEFQIFPYTSRKEFQINTEIPIPTSPSTTMYDGDLVLNIVSFKRILWTFRNVKKIKTRLYLCYSRLLCFIFLHFIGTTCEMNKFQHKWKQIIHSADILQNHDEHRKSQQSATNGDVVSYTTYWKASCDFM